MNRQRATPPVVNRAAGRHGLSTGGISHAGVSTLAPGMDDEQARYNATYNDALLVRDRTPYFRLPRYTPAGNGWVDWTAAGPIRPELGMRTGTWYPEPGATRSRFPVVNTPTTGLHTDTPNAVSRTVRRFVETPQMMPGRQDRLSGSRYVGQTYSQTTLTVGGSR